MAKDSFDVITCCNRWAHLFIIIDADHEPNNRILNTARIGNVLLQLFQPPSIDRMVLWVSIADTDHDSVDHEHVLKHIDSRCPRYRPYQPLQVPILWEVRISWQVAHVTPVHKKGVSSSVENYRPISLTSVICNCLNVGLQLKNRCWITFASII